MLSEEFFEAEFYKFFSRLNRSLAMYNKKLIHLSYDSHGFVKFALWDEKELQSEGFSLRIHGSAPKES